MRYLLRCGALTAVLALGASPPPSSLRAEDVLAHLEQAVAWYRHVTTGEPANASAGDLLLRESTRQSALQAVRLAFEFARAEAALLGPNPQQGQPAPASGGNLQQAEQKAANRVNSVQARITALDASIPKSYGKQRETLVAERAELSAELDLAKEIQSTVEDMARFNGTLGGSGLIGKINELERSIPEADPNPRKSGTSPQVAQPAASPRIFNAQSAGLIGLATDLVSVHASESQIANLIAETDALLTEIGQLKLPLLNEVRAAIQRSDQLANGTSGSDPQQLSSAQQEIAALTLRFKQLSTARIPLGDEETAIGGVRANLAAEENSFDAEYDDAARYLAVRAGTLGTVIAIVLFISALWRRAVFRYVHDSRRRRQFTVLRRVVMGFVITVALVLAFVSEFGSLATYAGFVTAGLALALQNVILSMVAYFFLIGRYGIRVGDRITISGVTGDVIDIGLVRLSMIELGSDSNSTGRLVVYSNSVIFQPSALFKQIPGINYVWHTVTLTLSPDSDFQIAEKKLNEAVDSVYQRYSATIEKQHATFEESIDVELNAPKPESRLRFADGGLLYSVRYPAEMKDAYSTDDQIMKALWDAIESEPKLKFAASGTPKLQPVS